MREALIDSLPAGIALLDAAGNIIDVNSQWRSYGVEGGNTDPRFGVGQNYLAICERAVGDVAGEGAAEVAAGLRAVLVNKRDRFTMDYPCHSPVQYRWFRLIANRLDQANRPVREAQAVVMHIDITAQRRAEDQLRIAARVFADAGEAIVVADPAGRIQTINKAFTRITGYTERDALGVTVGDLLRSGRQSQAFYETMWESLTHRGFWQGEIWNCRKSGEVYPQWITINRIDDEEGQTQYFVGAYSNIAQIKDSHSKVEYLANHDALTGLPNRSLFQDRLQQAIAQARRNGGQAALLFLDLDYFKTVNDTLGHEVGDQLLVQVAARLRELVRDVDTIARFGGDEFTVVLANCDAETARSIAQRLVAGLPGTFEVRGRSLRVTTSAGLALYPQDGDDVDTLSRAADMAMYQAKEDGRNRLRLYDSGLHQCLLREATLETALRRALTNDELRLVYQPQFDASTPERLVGAEALLRWQDPENGPISPGQFIPVAEKSDLITELGWRVQELLCKDLQRWLAAGFAPPVISFNVSPKTFREGQFAARLHEVMTRYHISPGQLQVEFTEGTLTDRSDIVFQEIQALQKAGVDLAIDDFGTGYSSLENLKRLPLAELKIDKTFVDGLGNNEHDEAIARASLAMAQAFGLRTVAEGVETPSQLAWLQAHGCDRIQGFLLARPLEAEDFQAMLHNPDTAA
ncbi:EAL domain-containing protein [Halomonas vilamensis]|uniref:EAL domain-containing protein n=1 Tax=Vreelandella vilamensis TaxID=531309 RepID=A0ABU1H9F1_9GAMM|nr:EAL domain-containing protein [Halomonas vilamensis]MDR5900282.1 EAL domain-containing protein [Halomonas vilamensis]